VPPLNAKDSKPFDFLAGEPVKANGTAEFRIYLDGTLYKSYPIGKKDRGSATAKSDEDVSAPTTSALKPIPVQRPKPKPKPVVQPEQAKADTTIEPSPNPVPTVEPIPVTRGSSSEEKTMKDLEP
jgi:hypothetical protein